MASPLALTLRNPVRGPLNWAGSRFLFSSPSEHFAAPSEAGRSVGGANENRSGPLCQEHFWTPISS